MARLTPYGVQGQNRSTEGICIDPPTHMHAHTVRKSQHTVNNAMIQYNRKYVMKTNSDICIQGIMVVGR